jgi:hypothetical protein
MTADSPLPRSDWWAAYLKTARLAFRPVAAGDLPSIARLCGTSRRAASLAARWQRARSRFVTVGICFLERAIV